MPKSSSRLTTKCRRLLPLKTIAFRNVNLKKIAEKGIDLSKPESLGQLAAAYADGIIFSTQNEELQHFAENNGKEFIHCEGNKENVPNIIDFYNKVCGE